MNRMLSIPSREVNASLICKALPICSNPWHKDGGEGGNRPAFYCYRNTNTAHTKMEPGSRASSTPASAFRLQSSHEYLPELNDWALLTFHPLPSKGYFPARALELVCVALRLNALLIFEKAFWTAFMSLPRRLKVKFFSYTFQNSNMERIISCSWLKICDAPRVPGLTPKAQVTFSCS